MGLSDKAILVCVSISKWGNRKTSQAANRAVEKEFQSKKKATNTTKKLILESKELEKVLSMAGSIGDFFRDNTLPWLTDGTRILASKNFTDFARQFQAKSIEFSQAVEDFIAVYPNLKLEAQKNLAALFNPADYPDENTVRSAFRCEAIYMPMPEVSDFRVEVSESVKESFLAGQRTVESEAVKHCFTELAEVIKNAADQLSKPTPRFRDTLLDNITKLCVMLPKLNVTENADLEATRREVETIVSKISPETCRHNSTERQSAAQKLKDIQAKMGAFMGVPNSN